MSVALKNLEDEAMKLPPRSRARLARRLITSRDEPADPDAKRLWIADAEARAAELTSGKVKPVSADKVLKRARAILR
jgi:putative addiction module component (TIGR02574 family)